MSVPVSAAPELLDFLSSGDAEEREVSIGLLAELVASAYGKDGVVLGEIVRDTGGLELLSQLLTDVSEQTRLGTLQVLVNLCSDAVDPNSAKTKRAGCSSTARACRCSSSPSRTTRTRRCWRAPRCRTW